MTIEIIKKETTFLSDVCQGEVFSFAENELAERNDIYIKLSANMTNFRFRYADLKTGLVFASDNDKEVILPKVSKLVIEW